MAGLGAEVRHRIKYVVCRPFHVNILHVFVCSSVECGLIFGLVYTCVYLIGHSLWGLFKTNVNEQ